MYKLLNPEKQLKMLSGFFLNRVNQMISGNSKGVNNRHVQFGSITRSGKGYNGHCAYMASPLEMFCENFEYYVRHLNKKILKYF